MKNYDKFYAVMSLIQGDKVLINEVRKYPYIYNQKHEHYKDTKLKDQTWQTIGEAINVKPGDAKNRWRNLRDRYVREKKLLITEGEDVYRRHEVWPYLEDMAFLSDLIVHRKTVNPVVNTLCQNGATGSVTTTTSTDDATLKRSKYKHKMEVKNLPQLIHKPMQDWLVHSQLSMNGSSNGIGEDVIEVDPWSCSINESHESNDERDEDFHPTQSKLRKLLLDSQEDSREFSSSAGLYDYSAMIHEMNNHVITQKSLTQAHPLDEDELFCLSVSASLKRFASKTKAAIKIRIQQLLYEAEFQEDGSTTDNRERN